MNVFSISRRTISFIKLMVYKLIFRKRFEISAYKQNLRLDTNISISKKGIMKVGKIETQKNVNLVCVGGVFEIGEKVSFNRNFIAVCRERIKIGNNCSFGPNICIYDHDHKFDESGIISNVYNSSEIIIDEGCWIGAGAIILRGTYIGKNSIIGAGTVVKGNIPERTIVTQESRLIFRPVDKNEVRSENPCENNI